MQTGLFKRVGRFTLGVARAPQNQTAAPPVNRRQHQEQLQSQPGYPLDTTRKSSIKDNKKRVEDVIFLSLFPISCCVV